MDHDLTVGWWRVEGATILMSLLCCSAVHCRALLEVCLSVCLLFSSSLQVCCYNRSSRKQLLLLSCFLYRWKFVTSLPFLALLGKLNCPHRSFFLFPPSSPLCFVFIFRARKIKSARKTKSCFNCRRLRCSKESSVYLRSQFLSVTFSVASCVCQDTETSFFRIAASSELSLLSASDPVCSGSSSSSNSNASILVCIVTSDSCFVYIIFVAGLQLSSLLIM